MNLRELKKKQNKKLAVPKFNCSQGVKRVNMNDMIGYIKTVQQLFSCGPILG